MIKIKSKSFIRGNLLEILFSILLTCNTIPVVFGNNANIVAVVFVVTCVIIIFKGGITKIPMQTMVLAMFLLAAHVISLAFHYSDIGNRYFVGFLVYGFTILILPLQHMDYKKIFQIVQAIGVMVLPFYLNYNYGYTITSIGEFDDGDLMTMSYRILPYPISALCSLLQNKKRITKVISAFVFLSYSILLLGMGARGAIISIVFFAALFFLFARRKNKNSILNSIVTIVALLLIIIFYSDIIVWLHDFLSIHNLYSRTIDRMYSMLVSGGDMSSGRLDFYLIGMDEFLSSPFIGNGIGAFDNFSGTFPHNIIIQLMVEGGLLFLLPFLYVFYMGLRSLWINRLNSSYNLFLVFIFCSGVVKLFFSQHLWGSQFCWIFIYLIMNKKYILQNASISNNSNI